MISNDDAVVVDNISSSTRNDMPCYENRTYNATSVLEVGKIYSCAVKSTVSLKVDMIAYDL